MTSPFAIHLSRRSFIRGLGAASIAATSLPSLAAIQGAPSPLQVGSVPSTTGGQARFDVASIHPSRPGVTAQNARFALRRDHFDAEAATVFDVLEMLDDFQLYRVVGGPTWIREDRYDIHAKTDAPMSPEEARAAVLALLAERFKLAVHRETRAIPTIVLTAPVRPAGLRQVATGEIPSIRSNVKGDQVFIAVTMPSVINFLCQAWHMPVVDRTELTGNFDLTLAPSAITPMRGEEWGDLVRGAVLAAGFKVDERKEPMEVTVVDRCERPSEN